MSEFLFNQSILSKKIILNIIDVGKDLSIVLQSKIKNQFEGKCCAEGYIKKDSCTIISVSSGNTSGSDIIFIVNFQCLIGFVVEGMEIPCKIDERSASGCRGSVSDRDTPFLVMYIITPNVDIRVHDNVVVKVIGSRYELNDTYISVIAQII